MSEGGTEAVSTPSTARSIYELHLIHPTTSQRHKAFTIEMIGHLLGGFTGPVGFGGAVPTLKLEVDDRRTGETVLSRHEKYSIGARLAEEINADLDRLDAAAFREGMAYRTAVLMHRELPSRRSNGRAACRRSLGI